MQDSRRPVHEWFTYGTPEREPDSVVSVSLWHIPGGYDYVNAQAVKVYFADMELAHQFEKKYHDPPEMAILEELVR